MTDEKEKPAHRAGSTGNSAVYIIPQNEEKTLLFMMMMLPELVSVLRPLRKAFSPSLYPLYDIAVAADQSKSFAFLANSPEILDEYLSLTGSFFEARPELFRRADDRELIQILAGVHRKLVIENRDRIDPSDVAAEFARTYTEFAPVVLSHGDIRRHRATTKYVVNPYIPGASLVILAGDGGTGKTYIAFEIARAVATGERFAGLETTRGNVLIIDEETGMDALKKRFSRIEYYREPAPEDAIFYCSYAGFNFSGAEGPAALKRIVQEKNISLVIIDALVDVMTGDENSAQDVNPVMRGLREITAATGTAIMLIHHSNKSGGYRGSTALKGAVDVLLIATQEKLTNDGVLVHMAVDKMRDARATTMDFALAWDKDGFTLNPYRPADRLRDSLKEDEYSILLALKAGRKRMEELVQQTALSKSAIHSRLRYRLAPFIEKIQGPNNVYFYALNEDGEDALSNED